MQVNRLQRTIAILEIKNGIICVRVLKGTRITLAEAVEFVEERVKLSAGRDSPMLIIDEGIISIDKAARDYLTRDTNLEGLTALAVVSPTRFSQSLFNFFLKRTNPHIPHHVFTDHGEAIQWLSRV